eukprot:gene1211-biopygen438
MDDPSKYQKHTPISYGLYVKSIDGRLIRPEVYTGENFMLKFMNRMNELNEHIREIFKVTIPMKALTQEQQQQHDETTHCFCCKKKFGKKVRDHCHITASIESVNNSNGDNDGGGNGDWFPGGIRYIDSFAFLSRGFAELENNVPDNELTLVNEYLRRTWNNVDFYEGFRLLRRKGVYPYDWVDSVEKMGVTLLPSQEEFYNELNDCGINDDDYEHAQNVWQFFRCNTFKDYHELYLVTDVLLLADVFESFQKLGMEYYGLDPAWYISLPAFAWDAMLKMTDIKLELLTEEKKDIYLLLERDFRLLSSEEIQRTVHLNKPIYLGFSILDLSKEHMYDYHYNYVKHAFPNAKLCYMDTDSFIYDIPRPLEEVHQIMNESSHLFDYSNYPKDHPNYSTTNKKAIGKMKDELEGKVMDEFIGLRPKMYSCFLPKE